MRMILFPLVAAGAIAAYPIVAQTSATSTSQPDTATAPANQADNAMPPSAYMATPHNSMNASNAMGEYGPPANAGTTPPR